MRVVGESVDGLGWAGIFGMGLTHFFRVLDMMGVRPTNLAFQMGVAWSRRCYIQKDGWWHTFKIHCSEGMLRSQDHKELVAMGALAR